MEDDLTAEIIAMRLAGWATPNIAKYLDVAEGDVIVTISEFIRGELSSAKDERGCLDVSECRLAKMVEHNLCVKNIPC